MSEGFAGVSVWGGDGPMTHALLARLLACNVPVRTVVVADKQGAQPGNPAGWARLLSPPRREEDPFDLVLTTRFVAPTTRHLAWAQGIPVYAVDRPHHPAAASFVQALEADLICTACFPHRIPPALLAASRNGFLNLHPSQLPAYRGPAPIFWQLRAGYTTIGVTVHWMDAELDTGDIAGQTCLELPIGAGGPEIDALAGTTGGDLIAEMLPRLADGQKPRVPQQGAASYQSWPSAADFRLEIGWKVQHAFNFMRGTAEWQRPYPISVAGRTLYLQHALAWSPEEQREALQLVDNRAHIAFAGGTLTATVLV